MPEIGCVFIVNVHFNSLTNLTKIKKKSELVDNTAIN